jgi:hypothetical protein
VGRALGSADTVWSSPGPGDCSGDAAPGVQRIVGRQPRDFVGHHSPVPYEGPVLILRNRTGNLLGLVMSAFAVLLITLVYSSVVELNVRSVLGVGACMSGALFGFAGAQRNELRIADDGVRLRGVFGSKHLSWGEVAGARLSRRAGPGFRHLLLVDASGRLRKVDGVGLWQRFRAPTTDSDVERALLVINQHGEATSP